MGKTGSGGQCSCHLVSSKGRAFCECLCYTAVEGAVEWLIKPSSSSSSQSSQWSATATNSCSFYSSSSSSHTISVLQPGMGEFVKLHMMSHLLQERDLGHGQEFLVSDVNVGEESAKKIAGRYQTGSIKRK